MPVNTTTCGDLTKSLCEGDPKLLNVVERMAAGKTLLMVALHRETKVQLVPRTKHQLLLGAQKDTYTHNEVFGQRSDHRSNGPYHEVVKKCKKGQHQVFLLRVISLSNTQKSASGHPKLAFPVKVFNTDTDRSNKAALKLGVVYGESIKADNSTVEEYVHNGSVARSPGQGPRIVMPKDKAPSPVQSPALGGPKLTLTRRFKKAIDMESCQQQAATGGGKQSSSIPRPINSAVSDVQSGEPASSGMLVWTDKPEPNQDGGTQSKKSRYQSISCLLHLDAGTC